MKEKILIILATGRTGYAATSQLLKEGYPVRVFVRARNKRALELEGKGAEIALGNFNNYTQWQNALQGIKRVYFNYPIAKGMPESVALFIRAAKEANVEAIVFMGQWLAEFPDQKSLLTNDIKKSYQLLQQSGLKVIYFNPGFFADNLLALTESIVQLGQMPSPFGNGKCPWISTDDLGRVIVALLKDPSPYIGQKIHPTGPESIDAHQMAAIYGKVIGRKVKVMPVSDKLFMKAVLAVADEFGYDKFVAVQTGFYMQELRLNRFALGGPTDTVKKLTGKEPEDFETIVRRFIAESDYGKRSLKGWLVAMKKFMGILFQNLPAKDQLGEINTYA